jgi:hypothetical protein
MRVSCFLNKCAVFIEELQHRQKASSLQTSTVVYDRACDCLYSNFQTLLTCKQLRTATWKRWLHLVGVSLVWDLCPQWRYCTMHTLKLANILFSDGCRRGPSLRNDCCTSPVVCM